MSLSPRRSVFALAIFSAIPLLAACPKKADPVSDAAPPPAAEDAAPQVLVPIEEPDAAANADAADAAKKLTRTGVNTNVARLRQCCNALGAEAKRLGTSPEAMTLSSAAAQCNTIAAQAGPTGTAPELGILRGLLTGRTIPAACAGF